MNPQAMAKPIKMNGSISANILKPIARIGKPITIPAVMQRTVVSILDMPPSPFFNNMLDCRWSNVVNLSQFSKFAMCLIVNISYFINDRFREFGMTISTSFCTLITTFFNSILDIIILGTKKKMRRITTSSIVTSMENGNPIWNFSSPNYPSNSMSTMQFTLNSKNSISACVFTGHPIPAIRSFIDFLKKIFEATFGKITLHLKFLSGVTPSDTQMSRGLSYA
jgi:hypothetical protein